MPPTRISVPGLIGGVSRQPQATRHPTQVNVADNVMMTVARGVEKRPPTEHVAEIVEPDIAAAKHIHWVDRGADKFVVLITPSRAGNDVVKVYNLSGVNQSVTSATEAARATYIKDSVTDPQRDLVTITVADSTFILNTKATTTVTVNTQDYQFNGTQVIDEDNEHNKLSWEEFKKPPDSSGQKWYAVDDALGHPAGFYQSQNHTVKPPWYVRLVTEEAGSEIDADTMPCKLFTGATFTLDPIAWNDRLSGDSISNPAPSFIGNTLTDITFHRGRLVFGSVENIIASSVGDVFNFWRDSYVLLGDADPIDIGSTSDKVSIIDYLIPFSKALVAFTSGGHQMELRGLDVLSPLTASLIPTTSFKTSVKARPVSLGNQLYFVTERGEFSQIYEYFLQEEAATNIAVDISAHAYGYIPTGIRQMVTSENNDLLLALSDEADEDHIIYVYQSLWTGAQKAQSSWFRWVFDVNNEILSMHAYDNELFLLIRRDSKIWLEKMDLAIPNADTDVNGDTVDFGLLMDRKVEVQGVYSLTNDETTFTLPYNDASVTEIVLGKGWDTTGDSRSMVRIPLDSTDSTGSFTILKVDGNYATNPDSVNAPVFIGRPYTANIEMSEQFVRDEDGLPVNGRLVLRNATFHHKSTGFYKVVVTPDGREPYNRIYTGISLGSTSATLGALDLEATTAMTARIGSASDSVKIEIQNDSPYPMQIASIEFGATFVPAKNSPTR